MGEGRGMNTVLVSEWLLSAAAQADVDVSRVMGEAEGELLFYALKSWGPANLIFAWPEVYYSSEFFVTLFEFCVDDDEFPRLASMLRGSDMQDDPELARLCDIAWDRIGLDAEVLA